MSNCYQYSQKKIVIKGLGVNEAFNTFGLKLNTKFLLYKPDIKNELKIYNLSNSSFYKQLELNNINYYDFHNYYENIFFVCNGRNIMIYEINIEKNIINYISKVQGYFTDVEYANFSPSEHNILISISKNYDIKVYDVSKSLPINHIFFDQPLEYRIIKWGENEIGVLGEKTILTCNYKYFLKSEINKIPFDESLIDFHFYNDNGLIVVYEKQVDFIIINEEKIEKAKIFEPEFEVGENFYSKKYKKLILFGNNIIIILSISYLRAIEVCTFSNDCILQNFIEESSLYENDLCIGYRYLKRAKSITLYSIKNNYSFNENKIDNISKKNQLNKFLENINKNISDIKFLISFENNVIKDDYILKKKYYEYDEIKKELELIKTRDIFARKEIVKNKIKTIIGNKTNFNSLKDIKTNFIFILKLLVNDNTNKELIIFYLKYLKENQELLKNIFNDNIEDYNEEVNYYLNIFNIDEAKKYFNINKISQKDNLFSLMVDLSNKNYSEFEYYLNNLNNYYKNSINYNMPPDFENAEYYFLRNIHVIKYSLYNFYRSIKGEDEEEELINEKDKQDKKEQIMEELNILKYKINKIIEFNNHNTLNLKEFEILFNILIQGSQKEEIEFNLNLLGTKEVTLDDIKHFINKNKDENKNKENTEKEDTYEDKNEKKKFVTVENDKVVIWEKNIKKYQYLCLNNLNLYNNDSYFSKKIYNYHYYKYKHSEKYKLSSIKSFYKKILPKACFRSIYKTLFGENEYYPFDSHEFTNYYIDKYYDFLPIKNDKGLGLTEKYSMNIYIISFLPEVEGGIYNKAEKMLLRKSLIINDSNHEIGHSFVDIHFFMENGRIPIETPRKKSLEINEGGYFIEFALYGRILETITMEQALYILNENNYDKTFLEFQEGFNNIQKKDLYIQGEFSNDFKNIKLNEKIGINKTIYIPQREYINSQTKRISCKIKKDVLRRFISAAKYNKIYKEYTY